MIAFFDMEVGGFGKVSGIFGFLIAAARAAPGAYYTPPPVKYPAKNARAKCPLKMSAENVSSKNLPRKMLRRNVRATKSR
ncbi:MAG: hypothetical protein MPJ81_03345 [Gammaproteobacteria bacterium]|nr:hypothetical protein [Gammaproteobacteria bacterium]